MRFVDAKLVEKLQLSLSASRHITPSVRPLLMLQQSSRRVIVIIIARARLVGDVYGIITK